jgi:hypothetical protein
MANSTDIINPETVQQGQNFFVKALDFIGNISEFIKLKIEYLGVTFSPIFATILTLFIGVLLVYIGSKISSKIAKVLLWILGSLLILGLIYSIVVKFIGS